MSGPYDVIICDPPWPISLTGKRTRARALHSGGEIATRLQYDTPTWGDCWCLLEQEVLSRAAPQCAIFLWTVEQFLQGAEVEMERRGFKRHWRLIWDKGESGFAPAFTVRATHEYLVWFYRGGLPAVADDARGKYPSVIHAASREHSRKPSAAYTMVEALYPDARKLDAFSREYRVGWSAFGDQIDHFSPLFACLREGTS